jgi:hypothetical protein
MHKILIASSFLSWNSEAPIRKLSQFERIPFKIALKSLVPRFPKKNTLKTPDLSEVTLWVYLNGCLEFHFQIQDT